MQTCAPNVVPPPPLRPRGLGAPSPVDAVVGTKVHANLVEIADTLGRAGMLVKVSKDALVAARMTKRSTTIVSVEAVLEAGRLFVVASSTPPDRMAELAVRRLISAALDAEGLLSPASSPAPQRQTWDAVESVSPESPAPTICVM